MGFQTRKSFKVMPGVRMTVSKSGLSTSVGVRGARVTRTASGRVTRTVGIPGSGLSHTKTLSATSSSRHSGTASGRPIEPPKPGMLAPRWEKDLYKAITTGRFEGLATIGAAHPEVAGLVATIDGLVAMQTGDNERALPLLRWSWTNAGNVADHPFVTTYIGASTVTVTVATGVTAALPFSRDAVGLALAELEQEAGNLNQAIMIVEALDPSAVAAVSLAELYLDAGRYQDAVDLTDGITNDDDVTALLVTLRGVALRELGHHTAAREAFKEALRSRSRDAVIRHRAYLERARAYLAENKTAMARKDLERILAEDSSFPGLRVLLDQT